MLKPQLMTTTDIAVIILAAGGSRRLGQPKQLLPYRGKSLLRHAASCAVQLTEGATFIVTGAKSELMIEELEDYDVTIIRNAFWEEGLSTSVRAGLSAALETNADLTGCLFTVCDQPYLSTALLQEIRVAAHHSGKGIAAAIYNEVAGTPVFFDRKYFPQLCALQGDERAQSLLQKYPEDLVTIPFAEGAIDIDTPDDYKKLTNAY